MLLTPPPRFSLNTTLILGPALQIVIVKKSEFANIYKY